ncbi:biotin-dependent carboxyltransferase family protein [Brevibacillus brevis]|uniref:5-oxoprolinase subunit C family protein n=1 Tax=Brevibacillus brevis TaxID=1393 RepID=UPI001C8D226A|nr:biotin-dependent carboxyltransferase family protein [Brevibacillus brevis]MBY0084239.1 biotin-dependent carboxyltransferase family protein [Brevibacillus brevis]UKK98427.1 biotin-dependent carboxyltransferase family protein [Brevibacillus brevis]
MSIEVVSPGLCTTVQDWGRYGYQRHGVNVGGAMDALAVQMANMLVGNHRDEAVLELTMKGPTLLFQKDMLIAICGGDLSPTINKKTVKSNRAVWVRSGSILQFSHAKKGCRAYLAVAGGWDVPIVMGSRSTNLRAGFGGLAGRMLQAGDRLEHNPQSSFSLYLAKQLEQKAGDEAFSDTDWFIPASHFAQCQESIVRVIRGDQFDDFTAESRQRFFDQAFQVSPQSDRMGYRLTGSTLALTSPLELISAAVTMGTIQVPPDGQPIILMADRQTIGGYPKIGYVATVDLPIIAQLRPGETMRFQEISLQDAQRALYERERTMNEIQLGIKLTVGWR